MVEDLPDELEEVLESAARLQALVPGTVLVGGSVAAMYARHRVSFDHDHVLTDLRDRYDIVQDTLDREGDFVLNRVVPGKIILGELGGIETGVRQLIRRRSLETDRIRLRDGSVLTVPSPAEILRIKAFLIVKRNQVRDYLDVAALSARYGLDSAGEILSGIDTFYADDTKADDDRPVLDQLVRQLSDPHPRDSGTTRALATYKGLERRWHDWDDVVTQTRRIAQAIAEAREER
jgi:hypothetical protein